MDSSLLLDKANYLALMLDPMNKAEISIKMNVDISLKSLENCIKRPKDSLYSGEYCHSFNNHSPRLLGHLLVLCEYLEVSW